EVLPQASDTEDSPEERLDISIQEGANARVGAGEEAKVDYVGENGPATSEICTILSDSDSGLTISESGWYAVTSSVGVPYIKIQSGADVHLILGDDKTLTLGDCIYLIGDAKLTIYGQSKGSGSLIGSSCGVDVKSGSTLTMYGGSISSNTNSGVYNYGTFNMYGGTVNGSTNSHTVKNYNEFTMNNGKIVSNYAYGVGVYNSSGNFTMNGGSITGGTSSYGVENLDSNKATFILNKGTVTGGKYAISGTVKNTDAGTGWTNTEGTEGQADIEANENGQEISSDFKKVQFPAASSEPSGITSWAELQEALTAAAQTGSTVTLTQHITCEDEDGSATSLTVPSGNAVTLDLAGYEINANYKHDADRNPIHTITVSSGATLTLVDSQGDGQICGGHYGIDVYGTLSMQGGKITGNDAGVGVNDGATFTMQSVNGSSGGTITGNSNHGVDVFSDGIFTMKAGEISSTQGNGLGIWLGGGTLDLQGGNLKNNKYGVIIETSGSTLYLQGAPVFSGNSTADIRLYNTTITLTGVLAYTEPISIKVWQDSPQTLTSAYSTYMGDTDLAKYFKYYDDKVNLIVALSGSEAALTKSASTVTFKNGGTVLQSAQVVSDTSPLYLGEAPTKEDMDWTGWTDGTNTYSATATLPAVSGAVTYTATFQNTPAEAPTISTQPQQNTTLTYGYETSDTLSVVATVGEGHTLFYKWYSCKDTAKTDAQEISGETSKSLAIPTGLAVGDYYYYCTVTSTRTNGETTPLDSDVAKVTVEKRPVTISAAPSEKYYGTLDPTFSNATMQGALTGELTDISLSVSRSDTGNDTLGTHDRVLSISKTASELNASYTNYIFTVTPADFTVKVNNQGALSVSAQDVDVTYDGTSYSINAQATLDGAAITYWNEETGAYDLTSSPTFTNQTEGPKIIKFEATLYGYASAQGQASLTIAQRETSVSASDASDSVYSGQEQEGITDYTFDNIISGQTASITYTPAQGTDVGTYEGVFSDDFKVVDDQGIDVTNNYKLTQTTAGKLTITTRPVSFTAQSETKDYTGQEIEITTVTPDGLIDTHTHNVVFSAKGTDVGDYTGTITAKEDVIIKDGDTDVTRNYSVSVTNGALTIQSPSEELTVSLDSKSYTYDSATHALLTPATTNGPTDSTTIEYSKDQTSWTSDLSTLIATDVSDSCTIYVKATNTNYKNVATSEATLTIQKAPAPSKDITESQKPQAISDLKSDGTEQPLVTPPTELPQGYTSVQYSLDGTTWQDEPPTGKDAGDYTVYVQYVGDPNHENYPSDPVSATIKAIGTLTFDLGGGTLNGSTAPLVIEALVGDTITIPDAPTLSGFTFKYWQGSEYYPGDKYTVEGSHTFTAVWQQNQQPAPTPTPTPNPTPQQPSIPRTGDTTFSATSALALVAISAICLTLSVLILKRRKS
ncbi:MAG: hypothetical protein IKE43_10330, partial [Coriobacteriales bacterium]|nr:hypothetical protein [Coriobacteriales bacterium]